MMAPLKPQTGSARSEYETRLQDRREVWQELERRDLALGYAKITMLGVAALVFWLALGLLAVPLWTALVPIIFFIALAVAHDGIIRARETAQYAMAFYEQGIRRLNDRWAGTGNQGDGYFDAKHPYAVDLDIFGKGSLFELLCTAASVPGAETLADWLKGPAPPAVIHLRQEAVAELRPLLDLREKAAILGAQELKRLDPDGLSTWGKADSLRLPPAVQIAALAIGTLTIVAGVAWLYGWSWIPFAVFAAIGQAFENTYGVRIKKVIREVDQPARDLKNLAGLLLLIEGAEFTSELLHDLRGRVAISGGPASQRIARLEGLVDRLNAHRNIIFAPIAALLLWNIVWGCAVERWRAENGSNLETWLAAAGEFEALTSFAGYAYEHPDDVLPEIVEGSPQFQGSGLRHPLIPESTAVPNDLELGDSARVWIVSGSNMSGKSTLLRTVGVNAVLALAGAPVRARSLRISPLQVGASIRTLDSLQGGISRFYAEILRLRQIVELADSDPTLFLLDEILHGTNSHDRLIGAEAVVRTLVSKEAIGLITTHDLSIARIAEQGESFARNVHFEDYLEDGKMRFNYRLKPGLVTRSNALELMRSVGLDV